MLFECCPDGVEEGRTRRATRHLPLDRCATGAVECYDEFVDFRVRSTRNPRGVESRHFAGRPADRPRAESNRSGVEPRCDAGIER